MKTSSLFVSVFLCLGLFSAQAQMGGPGRSGGPGFGGATAKIFGDNQQFSATVEISMTDPRSGQPMTMPGKLAFDTGNSRFEMNISDMKGGSIPPTAVAQVKAMGMDSVVSIACPDKNEVYLIYPGLQSYVENPAGSKNDPQKLADYTMDTTALGNETIDGHDCVKNKVTVTGKDGVKHESTVWNATDLKKFPVKIETVEQGNKVDMAFKNVSFSKPAASNFAAPTGYTKYDDVQVMVRTAVMKKMGSANAPGNPPMNGAH